jgi:hypothetical protein
MLLRIASKRANLTGLLGAPTNGATTPEAIAMRRHEKAATDRAHLTAQSQIHSLRQPTSLRRSWPSPLQTMTGNCVPDRSTAEQGSPGELRSFCYQTYVRSQESPLDKSPEDSLLFKQSAIRGISYALTLIFSFHVFRFSLIR